MKSVIVCILFTFLFSTCENFNKSKAVLEDYIPETSDVVFQVNAVNDFYENIQKHPILSLLQFDALKDAMAVVKLMNLQQRYYLAFIKNTTDTYDFIILTDEKSTDYVQSTEIIVTSMLLGSYNLHKKSIGTIQLTSNSKTTLESYSTGKVVGKIKSLLKAANDSVIASVVFKANFQNLSPLLLNEAFHSQNNYVLLDIAVSQNNMSFSGLMQPTGTTSSSFKAFKNIKAQPLKIQNIAPYDSKQIFALTYDNSNDFLKPNGQTTDSLGLSFLSSTNQIAKVDNVIVAHSIDIDLTLENLKQSDPVDTYRAIPFYNFDSTLAKAIRLSPFLDFDRIDFFSVYDNFLIFSESKAAIKSVLYAALNANTLSKNPAFKALSKDLSDESSIFIFKNEEALSKVFDTSLQQYKANSVQYTFENNYLHINGTIKRHKKAKANRLVRELFSTSIEADIISPPQLIKNHINKGYDVVVQDVNNVLYLISNSGAILWKKQLDRKILGSVEQVDIFKNKKLQMVFATKNKIHVIDRNGKAVAPFPVKFSKAITQPLSVFDYDGKRNYRFVITQNDNLVLYNTKGKIVEGFSYKANGERISSQPKHFRINTKDYIVFSAGNRLKILNRKGKQRVIVDTDISFSNTPIFLYKNQFTTTNTLGELIQVNTKGRLKTKPLQLTDTHYLTTTNKTLVTLLDNKLQIKTKRINLDYGKYTAPKIFYLNDKIYVTTTDLQAKKVYLFDSQAKAITNFPVFGMAAATLQNIDKDNKLELITQGGTNTILAYKME